MSAVKTIRAAHVYTSLGFVHSVGYFKAPLFENVIIVIGGSKGWSHSSPLAKEAVHLPHSRGGLCEALKVCSEADIVVLYKLDAFNSALAKDLPDNVVVSWRFFGTEIYARHAKDYLSKASYRLYLPAARAIGSCLKGIVSVLKGFPSSDQQFVVGANHVDLFLGLSECEHDHLIEKWGPLPRFVQWPLTATSLVERSSVEKKDIVIVGNSASIYNNHIDIIDLIDSSDLKRDYSFMVPFSYGSGRLFSIDRFYSKAVMRRGARSLRDFVFVKELLPRDEYFQLISQAKAAVFNSYCQMSMGNIFALLKSDAKIYLNNKNVIYDWFLKNGLNIFTIDDLKADLASGELELTAEEKSENAFALARMLEQCTLRRFADEIRAELESSCIGADELT